MNPELFDSHCHLTFDYAPRTVDDLVTTAKNAGVKNLMCVATQPENLQTVCDIAEQFEGVYHSAGFHPHDSETTTTLDIELVRAYAKRPKCKALGEMGLDYYYDHSDRASQRERFEEQLNLAAELALPVIIHCRDAETDMLDHLSRFSPKATAKVPGVIHCFTGSFSFAQKCLDLGFFISFSGIVTFKNAQDLRDVALMVPDSNVLVETDSPFLAPVPHRGKKCEPVFVKDTAIFLAQLRGQAFEALAATTTQNAFSLFQI